MKVSYLLVVVSALAFSPQSHAEGWLDSLKSMLGMQTEAISGAEVKLETPVMPNVTDMINSVSGSVGINKSQAEGSLASVFNYAKDNISVEQFNGLSGSLPGLNLLMDAVPDISEMTSEGGLARLMDQAANYNDSLKAVNELKKQFAVLGLEPEMIMQVIDSAQAYLDTDEGQKTKQQLMQALSQLSI